MHLAQVNIGRMKGPLESPLMAGFVSRLDDDDRILFNLSVWESVAALRDYVYRSAHVDLLRSRREWFTPFESPHLALWWVPRGHRPSVDEAKERLAHLVEHGPTSYAFSFQVEFPPDPPFGQGGSELRSPGPGRTTGRGCPGGASA